MTPQPTPEESEPVLVGPHVEVIYPDGEIKSFPLVGEKITVGSGEHADISLPDYPDLEPLHLLLAPRADGCWVSTSREASITAKNDGRLFENGVVEWGFELDVGALTFRITDAKAGSHSGSQRKRRLRKMLMVAGIAAAIMFMLREPDRRISRTNAQAPELFDSLAESCEVGGIEAIGLATQRLNAADARAERYAFEPNDGVQAVFGFNTAALCFKAGGDDETAALIFKERDKMRKRIEENYLFHRIRLERALDNERYRDALHEERLVAAMVRGRSGEYVSWLSRIDHLLESRARAEGK